MDKLVIIVLIIALLLMIGGCEKSKIVDNSKDLTASPSPTLAITAAPTITPTIQPSTIPTIAPTTVPTATPKIIPTLAPKELSMEAYKKFMKNETKVSFDRFMPEDYFKGALYKKGSEYTLSEVLDIITAHYFKYSTNKKIEYMDYGFIDCGKDGANELVLCFNGMDIYNEDDDSTLVYIIKYIDGKLFLCYYYETWARCDASINKYGYYQSGGSNGATNHGTKYGLIDKEGNWKPIVYIEFETDINQLSFSDELRQIPKVAKKKGISDGIELETIHFDYDAKSDHSDEVGNKKCFYTFYVYEDNWMPIKKATNMKWKTLNRNMFSKYVGS